MVSMMNKTYFISSLTAVLFTIASCATTDHSPEDAGITTINTVTAKEYFDRDVLFIDVRGDSYEEGHIPGSTNIYWNGEFNQATLAKAMRKNQEVVFYCDGPSCGLSIKASRATVSWGYENVYHYREGFPAWESAGYPIE
jgi:rhodanese-related sulfurtransferase